MKYENQIPVTVETTKITEGWYFLHKEMPNKSDELYIGDIDDVTSLLWDKEVDYPLVHILAFARDLDEITLNEAFTKGLTYEEALIDFTAGRITSDDFYILHTNAFVSITGSRSIGAKK